MFGQVVCHRVDAADDGSQWCSFFMYFRKAIYAWYMLVVCWAVNNALSPVVVGG